MVMVCGIAFEGGGEGEEEEEESISGEGKAGGMLSHSSSIGSSDDMFRRQVLLRHPDPHYVGLLLLLFCE